MMDDTAANPDKQNGGKTQRRETLTDDLIRAEFAEVSRARGHQRDDASEHPSELTPSAGDDDEKSPSDTPDQTPAHSEGCPRDPNLKQEE